MEAAQPSFIVGKDLSIEDHQVLNKEDDYDFTFTDFEVPVTADA